MKLSKEQVELLQDVLSYIYVWHLDEDAMPERFFEVSGLLEHLETRYGVKVPERTKKKTKK